ncbi:preprotein translocase subunit SecE [Guggenheimella bovis]
MAEVKNQKEKLPLGQRISQGYKSMRGELRKVTWLTRKELIHHTLIVIVMTLLLAITMGAFDLFFQQLFFHWL